MNDQKKKKTLNNLHKIDCITYIHTYKFLLIYGTHTHNYRNKRTDWLIDWLTDWLLTDCLQLIECRTRHTYIQYIQSKINNKNRVNQTNEEKQKEKSIIFNMNDITSMVNKNIYIYIQINHLVKRPSCLFGYLLLINCWLDSTSNNHINL